MVLGKGLVEYLRGRGKHAISRLQAACVASDVFK